MKFIILVLILSTSVFSQVPEAALTFDCNISMVGLSKIREGKILSAVEVIKQVVSTEEFRTGILSHKFLGKRGFADNKGLTNSQIYHKILAGAERLNGEENNTMDLEVLLYTNLGSNTIGYTFPSSHRVFINTKYFTKLSTEKIAANLVHEWLHKLGFSHDAVKTEKRKYSVPYAVGRMIGKFGKMLKTELQVLPNL